MKVITTSILPSLNPSLHPHRDIAASDYVIAATATLLNSSITIYHYCPNTPFTSTTFQPYPLNKSYLLTTTTIPPISLWCQNSHFLLLTKQHIPIPHPLTALPPLPISNHTNTSELTHIQVPPTYISLPNCPYKDPLPPSTLPSSFCPTHCHTLCPNHFNAFRPTPLKIYSPPQSPQQLITAIGIPPNTPLIEIASTISTNSSNTTFPVTNYAHSHALTTHPLIYRAPSTDKLTVYDINSHCSPRYSTHTAHLVAQLTLLTSLLNLHCSPRCSTYTAHLVAHLE